jgi:hypothetical protein
LWSRAVHLAGEAARLVEVGQVPDDGRSAPAQEVAAGPEAHESTGGGG